MAVTVSYQTTAIGGDAAGDFQLNSHESANQLAPDVLGLSGGGFDCAYNNYSLTGGYVFVDFYDSEGVPTNAQHAWANVATTAIGQPKLAELENGNVVVVWEDDNTTNDAGNPRASIFTSTGAVVSKDIDLFAADNSTLFDAVDVAARGDGGFTVSYEFFGDVFFRNFDAAGAQQGDVTLVNSTTSGEQSDTQVVRLSDGAFAYAWTDTGGADDQVRARIFEANGTARTGEFLVSAGIGDNSQPAIAALQDGGFAVAYRDTGWNETGVISDAGISLHVVDAAGIVSDPFHVNTPAVGDDFAPDVTVLANGFIAVSWTRTASAPDRDPYFRIYDPNGVPVTGQVALSVSGNDELTSALTALGGGLFLGAWQDATSDGALGSISGQVTELTRTVVGDGASDSYVGDALRDSIDGGGGGNTLDGAGGDDTIYGGSAADLIKGGADNDMLEGRGGADTTIGGFGNDLIYAAAAIDPGGSFLGDVLSGDAGRDTIRGSQGDDTVEGGTGDDKAYGGGGHDALAGDSGDDKLNGGFGDDTVAGGANADKVRGQNGDDVIEGGAGHDTLAGGVGDDLIYAMEAGDEDDSPDGDTLNGANGNDTLYGSAGGDKLFGLGHKDRLFGGSGSDSLEGGDGKDDLVGGGGSDGLYGGADRDVFRYLALDDGPANNGDGIFDLTAEDVIDLAAIDAKADKAGNQAFDLVAAFTGKSGQLVLEFSDGENLTYVFGDVDGDELADFSIALAGDHTGFTGFVL